MSQAQVYCAGCGREISSLRGISTASALRYHKKCRPSEPNQDINPAQVIELHRGAKRFPVLAICLSCQHRWPSTITKLSSPTHLNCPACENKETFVSFIPDDYLREVRPNG